MVRFQSVLAFAFCFSAGGFAQIIPAPAPEGGEIVLRRSAAGAWTEGPGFQVLSSEFGVEGKTVKGEPYSAQATTESTQTLADGNRIVNRNSSLIARDSEGRTRREQTLKAIGPWATGQSAPAMVFIHDPVANESYTLEPNAHTARKTSVSVSRHDFRRSEMARAPEMTLAKKKAEAAALESRSFVTESLGSKTIEGVTAEGKRTTLTIPAGQMGNDRPIAVVNEIWTSPELHVVVMSRHSDPRTGENVYTLTGIQRAEPDPALFKVPADYTVSEQKNTFIFEKKEN